MNIEVSEILSTPTEIWKKIRSMLRFIPFRESVDDYTGDVVNARIATAEELQRLVMFGSLGRVFVDVQLKIASIEGSPQEISRNRVSMVEATVKMAVTESSIITLSVASAQIPDHGLNPIGIAQSLAIKNALRDLGFRAEDADEFSRMAVAEESQPQPKLGPSSKESQPQPDVDSEASKKERGDNQKPSCDHKKEKAHIDNSENCEAFSLASSNWDVTDLCHAQFESLVAIPTNEQGTLRISGDPLKMIELVKKIREGSPTLMRVQLKTLISEVLHDEKIECRPARLSSCTEAQILKIAARLLKRNEITGHRGEQ